MEKDLEAGWFGGYYRFFLFFCHPEGFNLVDVNERWERAGEEERNWSFFLKRCLGWDCGIYCIVWLLLLSCLPVFSRCKEERYRRLEIEGGKGMEVERERKGMI